MTASQSRLSTTNLSNTTIYTRDAPGRARTFSLGLRRPALFRLSYQCAGASFRRARCDSRRPTRARSKHASVRRLRLKKQAKTRKTNAKAASGFFPGDQIKNRCLFSREELPAGEGGELCGKRARI